MSRYFKDYLFFLFNAVLFLGKAVWRSLFTKHRSHVMINMVMELALIATIVADGSYFKQLK